MSILDFINSRDVRDFLIRAGYQPDTVESAYIVWNSTKPLKEKHKAWYEILRTMPDMPVRYQDESDDFESIHRSLEKILVAEEELLWNLQWQDSDPDAVYEYYYRAGRCVPFSMYAYPNDFDGTYDAMMKEFEGYDLDEMVIRRNFLNPDASDLLHIDGIFDRQGRLIRIAAAARNAKEYNEKADLPERVFRGLRVDIPLPFEKGDIVVDCRGYSDRKPFVLSDPVSRSGKERGDSDTMTEFPETVSRGFFYSEGRRTAVFGQGPTCLDLEYYRGDSYPGELLLKACSCWIKGNIHTDDLLLAQKLSAAKEECKDLSWVEEYIEELEQQQKERPYRKRLALAKAFDEHDLAEKIQEEINHLREGSGNGCDISPPEEERC